MTKPTKSIIQGKLRMHYIFYIDKSGGRENFENIQKIMDHENFTLKSIKLSRSISSILPNTL